MSNSLVPVIDTRRGHPCGRLGYLVNGVFISIGQTLSQTLASFKDSADQPPKQSGMGQSSGNNPKLVVYSSLSPRKNDCASCGFKLDIYGRFKRISTDVGSQIILECSSCGKIYLP